MILRIFLPLTAGVLFLFACVIVTRQVPVETRDASVEETRCYIESEVSDPVRRGSLVRASALLAARVGQLNAFDAQALSRMTLLSADYQTSDFTIRSVARSVRRRRPPCCAGWRMPCSR